MKGTYASLGNIISTFPFYENIEGTNTTNNDANEAPLSFKSNVNKKK